MSKGYAAVNNNSEVVHFVEKEMFDFASEKGKRPYATCGRMMPNHTSYKQLHLAAGHRCEQCTWPAEDD